MEPKIISCANPPRAFLDELKQYASVPDDTREALLNRILTTALVDVQSYADVTLLPCTLEVVDEDCEDGIRLYQTPDEILAITADGVSLGVSGYTLSESKRLNVTGKSVCVRYKTKVDEGNLARLLPVVYQYATALYDGQNDKATLGSILAQC